MKTLGKPRKVTAPNAWGRDDTTMRQQYEVEESDVGVKRHHFLGLDHRDYTFTRADVGRVIEQIQGGCWYFMS